MLVNFSHEYFQLRIDGKIGNHGIVELEDRPFEVFDKGEHITHIRPIAEACNFLL